MKSAIALSALACLLAAAPADAALNATTSRPALTTLPTTQPGVPATGTGSVYASLCNSEKQSWADASGTSFISFSSFVTSDTYVTSSYSETTFTVTSLAPGATPFTLCDGFPRLDGNTSISTSSTTLTSTKSRTYTTTIVVTSNLPVPSCMIQSSDCAALNSSYSASSSAYRSYVLSTRSFSSAGVKTTLPPVPPPRENLPPMCGPATLPYSVTLVGAPLCFINTVSVRLLYWPVKTAADCNLCDRSTCSTTTMTPTIPGQPNTFKYGATILTSPTVYIAVDGTLSYIASGTTVSSDASFFIAQSSTAVSSLCGKIGGGYITKSVNYADFDQPVPAEAYRCQPKCFTNADQLTYVNYTGTNPPSTYTIASYNTYAKENQCSTIYNDYDPILSIPESFKSIAPKVFVTNNISCQFTFDEDAIFYDPPIALSQVDQAASASFPAHATATTSQVTTQAPPTAQPVNNSPTATLPQETSRPVQSSDPGSPASSVNQGTPSSSPTGQGSGQQNSQATQSSNPSDPSSGSPEFTYDPATGQGSGQQTQASGQASPVSAGSGGSSGNGQVSAQTSQPQATGQSIANIIASIFGISLPSTTATAAPGGQSSGGASNALGTGGSPAATTNAIGGSGVSGQPAGTIGTNGSPQTGGGALGSSGVSGDPGSTIATNGSPQTGSGALGTDGASPTTGAAGAGSSSGQTGSAVGGSGVASGQTGTAPGSGTVSGQPGGTHGQTSALGPSSGVSSTTGPSASLAAGAAASKMGAWDFGSHGWGLLVGTLLAGGVAVFVI